MIKPLPVNEPEMTSDVLGQITQCEECGCTIFEGFICQDCCEHLDCDDHCCLDCGREMAEEWSAGAYDQAKAARQDRGL